MMRRNLTLLPVFVVLVCCGCSTTRGASPLTLNTMFGSNMVLQREQKVPIWGKSKPGQEVTVALNGQRKSAVADPNGDWRVLLDPMSAGGPLEITVSDRKKTLKMENVMVGDVWLCAGQSNMAMVTSEVNNAAAEIARADKFPNIRLYAISKWGGFAQTPQTDAWGKWEVCSADTVCSFSAVAYFFARELTTSALGNTPIGLIDASRGATRTESWISTPTLAANFKWSELRESGFGATISSCYNGMIKPVMPYGIRGVLWYQGESNASRPAQFRTLTRVLIAEWRNEWNRPDLPFLFVQLPGYAQLYDDDYFMGVRESQLEIWREMPNTGMAVAIDAGMPDNVHPPVNKQDVGYRLALLAKALVYGQDVVYSGPLYDSMKIEGDSVRLKFKYVDGGLVDRNGGSLRGFVVAGEEKVFKDATARIEGDTVVVRAAGVSQPRYARYAWAPDPVADLYNAAGLPASPFRTDHADSK